MALSVSCLFDLDIGPFPTSESTDLVIPKNYKGKIEVHMDDGLRPQMSQGDPGEKKTKQRKALKGKAEGDWFCQTLLSVHWTWLYLRVSTFGNTINQSCSLDHNTCMASLIRLHSLLLFGVILMHPYLQYPLVLHTAQWCCSSVSRWCVAFEVHWQTQGAMHVARDLWCYKKKKKRFLSTLWNQ